MYVNTWTRRVLITGQDQKGINPNSDWVPEDESGLLHLSFENSLRANE